VDVCGKGGWSAEERGGACELWSFRLRPAYLRTAYNITVLFRVAVCLARAQLGGTTTSRRRWLNQRWVHVVDDRQRRLAGQGGRGAWPRRVQLDEDDDKAQGTCQTLILV